ncbi:MAG TPA: response regulator transcription factor [Candidatus Angelobacter sp.]|jgi:DNA-binding NarL/FixJ family response regulator|nr:response regulator transcription factor [Candidatus Angelobacter sp.]
MATSIQTDIYCASCPDLLLHLPARPRILLVDDSPELLDVVCAVLQSQYEIDVIGQAEDGQAALELVPTLCPDLIIMDVHMPNMDGLLAASIISTQYPAVSVVLMSGDDSPELRSQASRCGAKTFIFKPKFNAGIAEVLGIHRRKIQIPPNA